MQTIETRILEAEALWRRGDALVDTGDGAAAYAVYTQAHDLIMDCPSLHERAHRKLQRVSARHGHRGEILIDKLLVWLAPLGVFEAIARAQHSAVATLAACRRGAATTH
ncbi:MAG TPA: hypothetical protein VIR56_15800, partial [Solimonas sp.]